MSHRKFQLQILEKGDAGKEKARNKNRTEEIASKFGETEKQKRTRENTEKADIKKKEEKSEKAKKVTELKQKFETNCTDEEIRKVQRNYFDNIFKESRLH